MQPIQYQPHPDEPDPNHDFGAWLAWAQDPDVIDIYAIHARGDSTQVWYIGQTNNRAAREQSHRESIRSSPHKPLYAWLAEHEWEMSPIETVRTRSAARSAERRWVRHYARENPDLFNEQLHPDKLSAQSASQRTRKSRALKTFRENVEARGGTVHTDLVVLISRTGEVTLARWEGAELQKIKPTDLVSGNE